MKHAKHTPGPWTFGRVEKADIIHVRDSEGNSLFSDFMSDVEVEQSLKDAQLVSAAPEMLEALESTLATIFEQEIAGHFQHDQLVAIEKLIAKARGES